MYKFDFSSEKNTSILGKQKVREYLRGIGFLKESHHCFTCYEDLRLHELRSIQDIYRAWQNSPDACFLVYTYKKT